MKKATISILILLFVFGMVTFLKVKAGTSENVSGWLWGGGTEFDGASPWDGTNTNVGWISANSLNLNCDTNQDGLSDNTDPSISVSCPPTGQTVGNYGMNIPTADGTVTGNAWSENIGWISFNGTDLIGCPDGNCTARRIGNNIEGWARIISIRDALAAGNSGGWPGLPWQGWVKLRGTAQDGSSYGVSISGNTFLGYAWSDELGWIDFKRASFLSAPVVTLTANPSLIYLSPGEKLPKNFDLIWTVSGNATSCTASGSWNGNKLVDGGTETLPLNSSSETYSITCSNPIGGVTKTVMVSSGCNSRACSAGACSDPVFNTTSNGSDCSVQCSSDNDCKSGTNNWKEVAP